jgi:hypothetical protein
MARDEGMNFQASARIECFQYLSRWEIDQDHVGAFFKASENDFLSIRRDIEVVDEKISVEVG